MAPTDLDAADAAIFALQPDNDAGSYSCDFTQYTEFDQDQSSEQPVQGIVGGLPTRSALE